VLLKIALHINKEDTVPASENVDKNYAQTRWYIFTKDSHSNEVLAQALRELPGSYECSLTECADGKQRHLWEIPDYDFVRRLKKSAGNAAISFDVLCSNFNQKPYFFVLGKRHNKVRRRNAS
jgi:hypothetical protein